MRKLDDEKAYTEEDIAWIRQAGIPFGEERIAQNAEKFGTKVPDAEVPDDESGILRQVVGADAAGVVPEIDPESGAPRLVNPAGDQTDDEPSDDYDQWSKKELEDEVAARNDMPETSAVEVTGTGKNGNVLAADLIKGLRLWDAENPDALKGDDEA